MRGVSRVSFLEVVAQEFSGSVENLDLGGQVNCPPNQLIGSVENVLSHYDLFEIVRRF